jgi:hypothetical protein
MTVVYWRCVEHGRTASKVIIGRDGIPRCPACGRKMDRDEWGPDGPQEPKR